ncbi:hypothetical protein BDB01DRAFT_787766, partial [Pilobolus umbonatus]
MALENMITPIMEVCLNHENIIFFCAYNEVPLINYLQRVSISDYTCQERKYVLSIHTENKM